MNPAAKKAQRACRTSVCSELFFYDNFRESSHKIARIGDITFRGILLSRPDAPGSRIDLKVTKNRSAAPKIASYDGW